MSEELHSNDGKRSLFDEWMEDDHIMVHLDSRSDGVVVPEHLQANPALTLKLSYRFNGTTEVSDAGIRSNLLFGDRYFEVIIPWNALWGMTSAAGAQKIWPESVPADVMRTYLVARLKELTADQTGDQSGEMPAEEVLPVAKTSLQSDPVADSETPSETSSSHTPEKRSLKVAASHEVVTDEKKVARISRPFLKLIK